MPRPFRTSCFSFFSLRFSFSVLPDFFDATFRGDLSAMSTPFLRRILLPFGGDVDAEGEVTASGGHLTTPALQLWEKLVDRWCTASASRPVPETVHRN